MYRVYCYVCGRWVGFYGWGSHVRKHKKELGEDIYIRLRKRREGTLDPDYTIVRPMYPIHQAFLDDFKEGPHE